MFSPKTVRGIHKSCSGPYPGYDQHSTYNEPLPNGRIRPEAEENAQRHQGSLNLFGPKPYTIKSPRVKSRCPSEISRNNMEYSRKGTVCNIINGQASHRPDTPAHQRIRPEASEIAENHKGKSMASIFQNQHEFLGKKSRISSEEDSKDAFQSLTLLHHSADNPASYRPAPRVKPEAHVNAQGAKGRQMAAVLGVKNEDEICSPVVKPSEGSSYIWGRESVDAGGNSSQMKQLLCRNNTNLPLPAPPPRVTNEGQQMSKLDQGGRMNKLIHNLNSIPSSCRPPSRNGGSLTAKQIAIRNRGTVGNLLANIGSKQILETPGLKKNSQW